MAGLAKGLAILELFGPRNRRITAAAAAQATGITRAAARRCLLTLVSLHYLDHDGKFFTPARRLIRLGSAYLGGDTLAAAAGPILDRLRDQIGESVSLAVAEGDEALFITRATAPHLVSAAIRVGARWPLYCTAAGRVLLAARSDAEVERYLAAQHLDGRTSKTLTEVEAVRAVIVQARRRGYAASDEEIEIGLRAVAVPVRAQSGEVVAAIAVSASSARMKLKQMERDIVPVLEQAAVLLAQGIA